MRIFFRRLGNKSRLLDKIIPLIPQHKIYVEPFVGCGAVLFAKEKAEVEIINDLDTLVVEFFKLLKEVSPNKDDYKILTTVNDIQEFVNKEQTTKEDELIKLFHILTNTYCCFGYGKIYANNSGKTKIKNIKDYIERLKDVRIYNQDYKEIIKEYDAENAFFFLDPPYENNSKYKHSTINYTELRDELKNIKGKFLLTLNDSENIREIFSNYNIKEVLVKKTVGKYDLGRKDRLELMIMNY
jgi:DNA adenine methylase